MDGNALFDEYMRQRSMQRGARPMVGDRPALRNYPSQMQPMPFTPGSYGGMGGAMMGRMPYRMGTAPRAMQPMPYQIDPSNPMYRALMQRMRPQR